MTNRPTLPSITGFLKLGVVITPRLTPDNGGCSSLAGPGRLRVGGEDGRGPLARRPAARRRQPLRPLPQVAPASLKISFSLVCQSQPFFLVCQSRPFCFHWSKRRTRAPGDRRPQPGRRGRHRRADVLSGARHLGGGGGLGVGGDHRQGNGVLPWRWRWPLCRARSRGRPARGCWRRRGCPALARHSQPPQARAARKRRKPLGRSQGAGIAQCRALHGDAPRTDDKPCMPFTTLQSAQIAER